MAQLSHDFDGRPPLVLTVPGLNNSGPAHWQTLWEQSLDDIGRVDLGMWNTPHRNSWVTKLDQAIRSAPVPVILVAHSLGCLAVAWWAELSGQPYGWPVAGALLVAPPDVNHPDAHPALRDFAPMPRTILPFPAILVASEDDPYASIQASFDMARNWGCHFENVGACGHINGESGLGWWDDGRKLFERVVRASGANMGSHVAGNAHALLGANEIRPELRVR